MNFSRQIFCWLKYDIIYSRVCNTSTDTGICNHRLDPWLKRDRVFHDKLKKHLLKNCLNWLYRVTIQTNVSHDSSIRIRHIRRSKTESANNKITTTYSIHWVINLPKIISNQQWIAFKETSSRLKRRNHWQNSSDKDWRFLDVQNLIPIIVGYHTSNFCGKNQALFYYVKKTQHNTKSITNNFNPDTNKKLPLFVAWVR